MKRTELKRKTPMKRGKPLGPGKKTLAKREAISSAILAYFNRFGWYDEGLERVAPCQVSGQPIRMEQANYHHRTPRSEMRKAGVKDLDAPHRGIVCHYRAHLQFVHGGQMGRPAYPDGADKLGLWQGRTDAIRRFRIVENSTASAENGLAVEWSEQDQACLDALFRGGQ